MADYTMAVTVARPYDETVAAVREQLAQAGFGIITEIDMRATLKAKLHVDVAPQVILGACRPQLAHEALKADPAIAALLPCNVVVRAVDDDTTVIEAFDPRAMTLLAGEDAGGEALRTVAADARERLGGALEALSAA